MRQIKALPRYFHKLKKVFSEIFGRNFALYVEIENSKLSKNQRCSTLNCILSNEEVFFHEKN